MRCKSFARSKRRLWMRPERWKKRSIVAIALTEIRPAKVLAISDYGAQVSDGTGITMIFHYLEEQFRGLPSMVTFLRSAEHMQNWARVIKVASETGVLPSLHHPVKKRFPTVSAQDVGSIAGQLLTDGVTFPAPRVVHVEGPRRYDANEVAATLGNILGREVVARELPQSDWIPILTQRVREPSYAKLVFDLYVAHNAGRIDVAREQPIVRLGTTGIEGRFYFFARAVMRARRFSICLLGRRTYDIWSDYWPKAGNNSPPIRRAQRPKPQQRGSRLVAAVEKLSPSHADGLDRVGEFGLFFENSSDILCALL